MEFFTDEELEAALANEEAVRINGRKLQLHRCGEDPEKQKASQLLQKYINKKNESQSFEEEEEVEEKKSSFFSRNKQGNAIVLFQTYLANFSYLVFYF